MTVLNRKGTEGDKEYKIIKNSTTGLNCCLPNQVLFGNTVKLLKKYGYSTFNLVKGDYVVINSGPLAVRIFYVDRIIEKKDHLKGIIFRDVTGRIMLPLKYDEFLYNPLKKEIILQNDEIN